MVGYLQTCLLKNKNPDKKQINLVIYFISE